MKTTDAKTVLSALASAGKTLATAESCTGGWVGKMLTDIPGSSANYLGGVVSYTNAVKHSLLGVPQDILDTYGAVSSQTAEAMARGVRTAIGADFGISVTGLAGPDGDGSGRPVGLVYIAVCHEQSCVWKELRLNGDRMQIREAACNELFALLLQTMEIG